jgi:hypothetical protein
MALFVIRMDLEIGLVIAYNYSRYPYSAHLWTSKCRRPNFTYVYRGNNPLPNIWDYEAHKSFNVIFRY